MCLNSLTSLPWDIPNPPRHPPLPWVSPGFLYLIGDYCVVNPSSLLILTGVLEVVIIRCQTESHAMWGQEASTIQSWWNVTNLPKRKALPLGPRLNWIGIKFGRFLTGTDSITLDLNVGLLNVSVGCVKLKIMQKWNQSLPAHNIL